MEILTAAKQELQKAFHFREDDLTENRLGNATPSQIRKLNSLYKQNTLKLIRMSTWLFSFLGIIGLAGLVLFLIYYEGIIRDPMGNIQSPLFTFFVATAIVLISLVILFISRKKLVRDQANGTVSYVKGVGKLKIKHEARNDNDSWLLVDPLKFPLTTEQVKALEPFQEEEIIVYYFPKSRQISAIEFDQSSQ